MKRSVLLLSSALLAFASCKRRTSAVDDVAVVAADAARGLLPEHGGVMAFAADLRAEVLAQPDGRVLTYVTTPQGVPVQPTSVQVAMRKPDGQMQSVPVAYDPAERAYVGRAAGVPPGAYPVRVSVQPSPTAAAVAMLTAPVAFATTVQPPAPRHGGRVTLVGERAVEVAIARSGDIATFWTTLDGTPIAPAQIEATSIVVKYADESQPVLLHPSGDALVGHFAAGAHAEFDVGLPSVSIGGAVYFGAEAPHVTVVPIIPGAVFVVTPVVRPAIVVAQPSPPQAVFVAPPAPPTVVFAQPAPTVIVLAPDGRPRREHGDNHEGDDREHGNNGRHEGHDDNGRGHGEGHGEGNGGGNGGGHGHGR